MQILARVGDSDDCKDAVEEALQSFLGNYSYMAKTIKVVRAGSFKYWAQGHTLRSCYMRRRMRRRMMNDEGREEEGEMRRRGVHILKD